MDPTSPEAPDHAEAAEAAVAADPMMGAARERHPDVDIVLLPDPAATEPLSATDASLDQQAQLGSGVAQLARVLLARLRDDPQWPQDTQAALGWQLDEAGRRFVEADIPAGDLPADAAMRLLRATRDLLHDVGWETREVAGVQPGLEARHRPAEQTATAFATLVDDGLAITLRSVRVVPQEATDDTLPGHLTP